MGQLSKLPVKSDERTTLRKARFEDANPLACLRIIFWRDTALRYRTCAVDGRLTLRHLLLRADVDTIYLEGYTRLQRARTLPLLPSLEELGLCWRRRKRETNGDTDGETDGETDGSQQQNHGE